MRNPFEGCVVYSPPFQSGSLRIPSITILRHIRLRPAICTGKQAIGISASMKSGYVSPHTHECMHPIDVPKISRK